MRAFVLSAILATTALPATAQTCWMEAKGQRYNLDYLCIRSVATGEGVATTAVSPAVEFAAFRINYSRFGTESVSGTITNKSGQPIRIRQINYVMNGQTITTPIDVSLLPGAQVGVSGKLVFGEPDGASQITDITSWVDGQNKAHTTNIATCLLVSNQEAEKKCNYR